MSRTMNKVEIRWGIKHILDRPNPFECGSERISQNFMFMADDPEFMDWLAKQEITDESHLEKVLLDFQKDFEKAVEIARKRNQ